MTVSGRDRWSAVGLAAIALGYLLAGRGYALDTLATPGPGVFPLAGGLALLALAAWQFATAGRVARPPTGDARSASAPGDAAVALTTADASAVAPGADVHETSRRRAPLVMVAVLILYAAALPVVGFLLASFILVVVAARLTGLPGWWRPAALALGVVAVSRVVFVTWLGVPLP
jgi:Tripartite tricarboxylate transporter TctB family